MVGKKIIGMGGVDKVKIRVEDNRDWKENMELGWEWVEDNMKDIERGGEEKDGIIKKKEKIELNNREIGWMFKIKEKREDMMCRINEGEEKIMVEDDEILKRNKDWMRKEKRWRSKEIR